MAKGLDSPKSMAGLAAQLAADGYAWVARYLFDYSSFKDLLSHTEAVELSERGLSVVSVWENGYPTTAAYFTATQGAVDGTHGARKAAEAGMPPGIVYFACDGDIAPDAADGYFVAVRTALRAAGGNYLPGAYGSGAVTQHLLASGLVSHVWLAQSRGWRGYETGVDHSEIVQGGETTYRGVDVDVDMSNGDAGGWQIKA